ncbi:MAG: RNase P subunit p30 family protein [Halobacteriaceae archaeon]
MYEAVRAAGGEESGSTVARLAATAGSVGFDGVVVRNAHSAPAYDAAAVGDAHGVDVVAGAEVVAEDPTRASGHVGNLRPKYTVLCLRGGTPALNRFAVENRRVDVLTRPMTGDGDFNHVLARAAAENGVAVEVRLAPVLRSAGGPRVRAVQRLRKLRDLLVQYDAPFVVSADPERHLGVRAPRELVAVGEQVGLDAEFVREGLREWGAVAERNRHRLSGEFISPGVERGGHEEDS